MRQRRAIEFGGRTTLLTLLILVLIVSGVADGQPVPLGSNSSPMDRPIQTLRDLNDAFVDIAARVKPAVVTVSTERLLSMQPFSERGFPFTIDPFFERFFGPRYREQPEEKKYEQHGLGSGVIVTPDGYILTNNHVVADADSIFVRTHDGRKFAAEVVGGDPKTDIAVLKIDADGLQSIEIGDSDELKVGEIVLAIGSPMSENLAYSVSQGIVSAKGRANVGLADYEDFIQTDAAINPGNSGGPLVNLDGRLVGLNAAIASRTGGFQGIGFAVPANMAERVMNSLIEEGKVVRGWLGVYIQDVTEELAEAFGVRELSGALVGEVVPDSPAERAGLQAGDVIVELDGRRIANISQLRSYVASSVPGHRLDMTVLRQERTLDLTAELGELPDETSEASISTPLQELLGFTVRSVNRQLREQYDIDENVDGAVVTSVDRGSRAFSAGLQEGDLITSANRQRVRSEEDFGSVVSELQRGDRLLLKIQRQQGGFFIAFTL